MTPVEQLFTTVHWEILDPPVEDTDRAALPYATHRGEVRLGNLTLICLQLSDGQRVFEADSVARFFTDLTAEED